MTTFCIDRLKSVKLTRRSRIVRIDRKDLMDKFKREAHRVLDKGRGAGVPHRQTQSPRFDEIERVNSFVKLRISNLSRKSGREKIVARAKHFIGQTSLDSIWQGILLLETAYALYPDSVGLVDIDNAAEMYWQMVESEGR